MENQSDELKVQLGQDSPEEDFTYRYSKINRADFEQGTTDVQGGAVCLCTAGSADVIIGTKRYVVEKGYEVILLNECSLFITGCTDDLNIEILSFSRKMAFQAMRKFDPLFFRHMRSNPIYRHRTSLTYSYTLSYLNIIQDLQMDGNNRFNVIIVTNLLRSLMLTIYDKILRYESVDEDMVRGRKKVLFDRFMALINEHGQMHREVSWYADRLCISPRYLCSVVREVSEEKPKAIIDRHIISEIKLLLTFSDLSIQQIADRLNFPDQSYLGRFFRKATGQSPLEYRKEDMMM
ncbi:MAG: helix-turn-helix domain-containing protein [Candidatus Cryptobacteroides sp.]